jgi:SpoVK/Ycf46/Vps4 family AAA+-type ATPase
MGYAKKFFKDNVILGLERPDLFAKYKKSIHDGFLLYGPPGIGKTFVCGALAKEAKMKLLVVSIHQLLDMYLGNTEKNIHAVFEQARENAPCMILFDEIDGLGVSRRVSRESGNASSALALNQLLMEMDGLESDNKNVIVMGTTNAPQDVDTALLRSGRFTNILYMRPPDKEDRTKLFEFYVDDIPKGKLDYGKLGEESNNLSPADIKAVVKTAVTPLIAEAAEGGRTKDLTTDSLLSAIRSRRAAGSTMIKWYEDVDKVLQKGGFSEEDKLLYSDMLKDVKKRVKRAPRKNRRRARKAKSSMEITNGERLRS